MDNLISKILLYPNPILYLPTNEVVTITEDIKKLKDEMSNLVSTLKARGISASQLGKSIKAIYVKDLETNKEYFALNPEIIMHSIIETKEDLVDSQEGCLSFPGLFCIIKRYKNITVKYKTIDNTIEYLQCSGDLSYTFQHEIDHLDNILLCDSMSNTQKKRNKHYFKELTKFFNKNLKLFNKIN